MWLITQGHVAPLIPFECKLRDIYHLEGVVVLYKNGRTD